ncbi:MAG: hypothetical protein ABI791_02515 [Acidobacteriota bacterium]
MKTERILQIAAVILVGVAAYFFWTGYSDGVFASAVLAAAAFFLSLRYEMKERNDIRKAEAERRADEDAD